MRPAPKTIELSSVYFYEGATAPRTIQLRDCGLPLKTAGTGLFAGLYGYQSKTEGFMAARVYADKHRMRFTVVDYLVRLEHQINRNQMKPEEIDQHDFVSFTRITRSLADEVGELIWKQIKGSPYNREHGDDVFDLLANHPEAIKSLTDDPRWKHLKVIAYHAILPMSETPLAIGVVPEHHWQSISEATCRLDPTTRVTLEPPRHAERPTAPSAKYTGPRLR